MKVAGPNPSSPALSGGVFSGEWMRWLRDLWVSLGHDVKAPMYDEVVAYPGDFLLPATGAPTVYEAPDKTQTLSYSPTDYAAVNFRVPSSYRPGSSIQAWLDGVRPSLNLFDINLEFIYVVSRPGELPDAAVTLQGAAPSGTPTPSVGKAVRVVFGEIPGSALTPGANVRAAINYPYAFGGIVLHVYVAGLKYERVGAGHEKRHPNE